MGILDPNLASLAERILKELLNACTFVLRNIPVGILGSIQGEIFWNITREVIESITGDILGKKFGGILGYIPVGIPEEIS